MHLATLSLTDKTSYIF